eukprot:COSAG02_NODE_177_length_31154_cov_32.205152_17_plen_59_part_00
MHATPMQNGRVYQYTIAEASRILHVEFEIRLHEVQVITITVVLALRAHITPYMQGTFS